MNVTDEFDNSISNSYEDKYRKLLKKYNKIKNGYDILLIQNKNLAKNILQLRA